MIPAPLYVDNDTPVPSSDGGTLVATVSRTWSGVFLRVDLSGHTSGLVAVTVLRTAGGVTVPVRGMDQVIAPNGVLFGFDHELPRDTAATYVATSTAYSSRGVTVALASGAAVLKYPSDPSLSVILGVDAYPEWTDGIDEAVLWVEGRPDPIGVYGVRHTGVGTLTGVTRDPTTLAALRTLLAVGGGGPYLLQSTPWSGEEDVWVTIGETKRTRWSQQSRQPRRNHTLPMTQVARPPTAGASIAIPAHRYVDLVGTWASQTATKYVDL